MGRKDARPAFPVRRDCRARAVRRHRCDGSVLARPPDVVVFRRVKVCRADADRRRFPRRFERDDIILCRKVYFLRENLIYFLSRVPYYDKHFFLSVGFRMGNGDFRKAS